MTRIVASLKRLQGRAVSFVTRAPAWLLVAALAALVVALLARRPSWWGKEGYYSGYWSARRQKEVKHNYPAASPQLQIFEKCRGGATMNEIKKDPVLGTFYTGYKNNDNPGWFQELNDACKDGRYQWKLDRKDPAMAPNGLPCPERCPTVMLRDMYPCKGGQKGTCCSRDGAKCKHRGEVATAEKVGKAKSKGCIKSDKGLLSCPSGRSLTCNRGSPGTGYAWRCCVPGARCDDLYWAKGGSVSTPAP